MAMLFFVLCEIYKERSCFFCVFMCMFGIPEIYCFCPKEISGLKDFVRFVESQDLMEMQNNRTNKRDGQYRRSIKVTE